MANILIVEDNKIIGPLIKDGIEKATKFNVTLLSSLQETKELFAKSPPHFFVALLDVNLPDAPEGETIDYISSKKIPVIVFTGGRKAKWHDKFWSKHIVDYVLKDGPDKLIYLILLIQRLKKNENIKVLVVDDSTSARKKISRLLETHRFITLEAASGKEALQLLNKYNDIKLVVSDYEMPDMNGTDLTLEIRKKYNRNQLAIIGISSVGSDKVSGMFLKSGANDYINKPLIIEEFYCRIINNIQTLEYIETINDISNRDYLTSLYNRRYFFTYTKQLYEIFKRQESQVALAMIDIDFFKKINDTYGHEAGDLALKSVSSILANRFRASDLVCRFGGEEFCVLCCNIPKQNTIQVFEELRQVISETPINIGKKTIHLTISIGICTALHNSIDEMVNLADDLLYQAKNNGRNQVITD